MKTLLFLAIFTLSLMHLTAQTDVSPLSNIENITNPGTIGMKNKFLPEGFIDELKFVTNLGIRNTDTLVLDSTVRYLYTDGIDSVRNVKDVYDHDGNDYTKYYFEWDEDNDQWMTFTYNEDGLEETG